MKQFIEVYASVGYKNPFYCVIQVSDAIPTPAPALSLSPSFAPTLRLTPTPTPTPSLLCHPDAGQQQRHPDHQSEHGRVPLRRVGALPLTLSSNPNPEP